MALGAVIQAVNEGLDMSLEDAYNTQFPALQALRGSNDSREGVAAFTERRKPNWTGT